MIALRALAYLWALPGTILGLLLGVSTLTRPTIRNGIFVFQSSRGFAALHRRIGFAAITLGHVMIVNATPSDALWAHELVHVRQWAALGPLMLVAYPLASIAGYRRNPFEVAARRRARR